jgi:two-component system, OmpR family, response regulator CpxR
VMFDRSIDVHVSSLRRKLGSEVGGIERIKAIRGVGYIYAVSDAGEPNPLAGGERVVKS